MVVDGRLVAVLLALLSLTAVQAQFPHNCTVDGCANGGTCPPSGANCTCLVPFGGPNCAYPAAFDCSVNPCLNNGTCVELIPGFLVACICPAEFNNTICSGVPASSSSSGIDVVLIASLAGGGGAFVLLLILILKKCGCWARLFRTQEERDLAAADARAAAVGTSAQGFHLQSMVQAQSKANASKTSTSPDSAASGAKVDAAASAV